MLPCSLNSYSNLNNYSLITFKAMFVKYAGLSTNLNLVATIQFDAAEKEITFYASPVRNYKNPQDDCHNVKTAPVIDVWGFDGDEEYSRAVLFIEGKLSIQTLDLS